MGTTDILKEIFGASSCRCISLVILKGNTSYFCEET